MENKYKLAKIVCYLNFICAAAATQLIALLLTSMEREYGLTGGQLSTLISLLFTILLFGIPVLTVIVGKTGYKIPVICEQVLNFLGLAGLGIFGEIFPNPYQGLLFAVVCYSVAGCISETTTSAVIGMMPAKNKDREMNMLHAFNGWSLLGIVLLSTAFFTLFGENNWKILPLLVGIVPAVNLVLSIKAEYPEMVPEEDRTPLKDVFRTKIFILFVLFLFAEGAVELCMSSWVSVFAESALHINKSLGDLLGPGMLTLGMALSRTFFGFKSGKIPMEKALTACSFLAFCSYMLVVFAPVPMLSFVGCGLEGLAVGILIPGILCLLGEEFPKGGSQVYGAIVSFMYISSVLSNKLVGYLIDNGSSIVPENLARAFHASTGMEAGLKMSLFAVGLVALFMFVVSVLIYGTVKKQRTAGEI